MDANHYTTNALGGMDSANYPASMQQVDLELREAVEHLNTIHEFVSVLQECSNRVSSGLANRQVHSERSVGDP